MSFSLTRFSGLSNVLGMNRRNADYIMRWNPRLSFPLVDNKVLTKQIAKKHHIPTPPTYHIVERQADIGYLEKIFGKHREFVIKPARGSGGSGIIIITHRKAKQFFKPNGEAVFLTDLAHHVSNILSGVYSLSGLPDCAIIEALIHPDHTFDAVSYRGVPDIRILVYRGVPVMAMLRLPTRASKGMANLHRGAIGAGIDIVEGRTLSAVCGSRVVTRHPDTGKPVRGIFVPHWGNLLLIAARTYDMTGMGYVGVDLVIDRHQGPLLLELNARPGLGIQLANQDGLLPRLHLVDGAPPEAFTTAENRIRFALQACALRALRKAA